MKQLLFTLVAALFSVASLCAQQIAVVNGSGSTSVYDTLDEAIEGATSGSTIYLPGGGFQVSAETKISKCITIMGIGHKFHSENADGNTTVSGDLNFAAGSDGSAVMGIYLSGTVNIGVGAKVSNILVKYCNVGKISVSTAHCPGIVVNQNYVRSYSSFNGSDAEISNNVISGIAAVDGGTVSYNIVTYTYNGSYNYNSIFTSNSSVYNNLTAYGVRSSDGNQLDENTSYGVDDSKVFVKYSGIGTASDLHFRDDYTGDRNCGVYAGGTGFNDGGLPPMPHIISKSVAEQTDAQGKLKIRVTVKAN